MTLFPVRDLSFVGVRAFRRGAAALRRWLCCGVRRAFPYAVPGVLSLGLVGCMVDQHKDIAVYNRYLAPGPKKLTYDGTGPLGLQEAIQLAAQNNEQLALQGENYLQALIDRDRSVARFLPTVSLAPSYTREPASSEAVGDFVRERTTDVPVEAQLSTNLPADAAHVKVAGAQAEVQRRSLLDLKSTVELDVAQVYYQILRSEHQLAVIRNNVAVQKTALNDARTRRAAGTALAMDVTRAEAQLADTEAARTRARGDVSNGRALLAFLIGVPRVAGKLSDRLTVPAGAAKEADLLAAADHHREDLQAARENVRAAAAGVKEAWRKYFPSVSLDLSYFLKRQSFPADVPWVFGVGINLPLFQAGLIHDDVRTAYSRLRQATLSEAQLQRRILKQIRVARENLLDSQQLIGQLRTRVHAAEDALHQTDQAYRNGLATALDRLTTQENCLQAQLQLTSEIFTEKVLYLELRRATGESLTKPADREPTGNGGKPKKPLGP